MATTKTERIEIDLPEDIIFAMRVLEKPEEVKKKLKIAFLGKSEISFELLIIAYKPRFKDISSSDNERACPIFGRSGK